MDLETNLSGKTAPVDPSEILQQMQSLEDDSIQRSYIDLRRTESVYEAELLDRVIFAIQQLNPDQDFINATLQSMQSDNVELKYSLFETTLNTYKSTRPELNATEFNKFVAAKREREIKRVEDQRAKEQADSEDNIMMFDRAPVQPEQIKQEQIKPEPIKTVKPEPSIKPAFDPAKLMLGESVYTELVPKIEKSTGPVKPVESQQSLKIKEFLLNCTYLSKGGAHILEQTEEKAAEILLKSYESMPAANLINKIINLAEYSSETRMFTLPIIDEYPRFSIRLYEELLKKIIIRHDESSSMFTENRNIPGTMYANVNQYVLPLINLIENSDGAGFISSAKFVELMVAYSRVDLIALYFHCGISRKTVLLALSGLSSEIRKRSVICAIKEACGEKYLIELLVAV